MGCQTKKSFKSIIVGVILLKTFSLYGQAHIEEDRLNIVVTPEAGFCTYDLRFSIAGNENGTNPNILSELKWQRIKAIQNGLSVRIKTRGKFMLFARYAYAITYNGNVSDIDYSEDNRKGISSEQNFNSNKGFVNDFDIKIYYRCLGFNHLNITTFIAYNMLRQKAYLLSPKMNALVNNLNNEELNSFYFNKWSNLGCGSMVDYMLFPHFFLQYELGFYMSKYSAYGDWNLIKQFEHPKSFIHNGTGSRMKNEFSIGYQIKRNVRLSLTYDYYCGSIRNGKDILHYADGTIVPTKLNEVIESLHLIKMGIQYSF